MELNKEIILEIIELCQIMSDGENDRAITLDTYSEKFKPLLSKFKDKYGKSPNLYLQDELKKFYNSSLAGFSPKLDFKSFGFWGRTIYNYTWSCIYYDFGKEDLPASFSPQLYIVINKDGIKFGFCYGNYIEDKDALVVSALSKEHISILNKCFDKDKDLCFFNSNKDEVTARPEKLFGTDEKIIINSDDDIIRNWSNNSLLIKEYFKDNISVNIGEIIQSTLKNLKEFYLCLLPIDYAIKKVEMKQPNPNMMNFNTKSVQDAINLAGIKTNDKLVSRFASALLTKPFVILTGLSGSGKTKLAQAFAMWICESKSQHCIVPVGADWTNREPLLGFPNALKEKEYVKPDNRVLDLIIEANDKKILGNHTF